MLTEGVKMPQYCKLMFNSYSISSIYMRPSYEELGKSGKK